MEAKLIRAFIKELIENNNYYERIRKEYSQSEDKNYYIDKIQTIFEEWFNAYFSIYTIMNTIEDYMNVSNRTFKEIVEDEEFILRDY